MNLKEAYEYVNSRYTFTTKSYPVLAEIQTEEYKKIFAFKHIILHFNKRLNSFNLGEEISQNLLVRSEYQRDVTKTFINILTLMKLCGIEVEEIANVRPDIANKNFDFMISQRISILSGLAESYDHGRPWNQGEVEMLTKELYLGFLECVAGSKYISMEEVFELIPQCMKSK